MKPALRISIRTIGRHRWRSIVVVAMVLLPVGVLTGLLASMAGSDAHEDQLERARLQGAQVLWGGIDAIGPVATADDLRHQFDLPGTATFTEVRNGRFAQQRGDGTADERSWTEADWTTADARRVVRLTDGRLPTAAGEVAVSDRSHPIGSAYQVTLPAETATVVGWITPPRDTDAGAFGSELVAAPGTFPESTAPVWTSSTLGRPQHYWRISGLSDAAVDRLNSSSFSYSRSSIRSQFASVGLSTFGFAWCGLVSASALAIGARRRRRELGLLSTNGATPRQLRSAIVADGVVLGGAGAVLGVAVGIGGVAWWNDVGVGWFGHTGTGWRFTPLIIAAAAMGWSSAVLAGALAGRGVSRQPTVDLLAGRGPQPGSAPRWLGTGLGSASACFVLGLLAASSSGGTSPRTVLQVACGATAVIALIAISVGLIRMLPGWTARRGVALRTAARDLARFGARTTAATAAIAITMSGATFASIGERQAADNYAAQLDNQRAGAGVSANTAILGARRRAIVDDRLVEAGLTTAQMAALRERGQRDGFSVTTLHETNDPGIRLCVANGRTVSRALGYSDLFDDDGCLTATEIKVPAGEYANFEPTTRDALVAGRIVGYSSTGLPDAGALHPELRIGATTSPVGPVDAPIMHVNLTSSPFTEALASGGGGYATVLVPESAWSPALDRPSAEVAAVIDQRSREGDRWYTFVDGLGAGVRASNANYGASGWSLAAVVGAGAGIALVCLIVLTLALVLVRIESRDEENVLVTQGASRALIAHICGWRAALVTWTAAVPAVVLSLAFAWVVGRAYRMPHPLSLVALLIGMPVLAGLIFGASGLRRQKPPVTTA